MVVPSDDCVGHPMLFRETYGEVFAQKWLTPDESMSDAQKLLKCSGFYS
jgi:hypothetical protein